MKELLSKVKHLEIKVRRMVRTTLTGEYRSAFKGAGLEFDEVRAYQFGDDIRSIDWNVTAKSNNVYVKIFREERELNVFVLFDISGSEEFGPEGAQKLQIGAEITAILAFCAQNNNDRFGLLAATDQVEFFRKPTKGRKQVLSTISKLLNYKPNGRGTNLRLALDFFRRIQRKPSVLFIVSDFLDTGYEKTLALLVRRHEINLVRLYHPSEALRVNLGIIPVVDVETGNTRWVVSSVPGYGDKLAQKFQDIDRQLEQLKRRYGLGYLSIDVTRDYLPVLEKFFLGRGGMRSGK
jgi:uncharacterized protein (DUF58 family)